MNESWRPIPGYEGIYSVSDHGLVRSEAREVAYMHWVGRNVIRSYPERILSQKPDTAGYPCVALSYEGKTKHFRVHSLMLKSFVGPRPPGAHGRHLDDDKTNNRLSNLAWGTPLDNSRDKYRNGSGNQYLGRTHCGSGHELTPENIYPNRTDRRCVICARDRARIWNQQKKYKEKL